MNDANLGLDGNMKLSIVDFSLIRPDLHEKEEDQNQKTKTSDEMAFDKFLIARQKLAFGHSTPSYQCLVNINETKRKSIAERSLERWNLKPNGNLEAAKEAMEPVKREFKDKCEVEFMEASDKMELFVQLLGKRVKYFTEKLKM